MMLKIEVFCGVTLCHLGFTATITSENTLFFKRQSVDIQERFCFSGLLKYYMILMTEYEIWKQ